MWWPYFFFNSVLFYSSASAYLVPRLHRIDCFRYQSNSFYEREPIASFPEIEELGIINGIIMKPEIGPLSLRIDAYSISDPSTRIGYLSAFIRPFPFGLLQLDTIQVANRRQILGFKRKGWRMSGPGITFVMGIWALRWAYDKGCKRAELLAVDDSDKMHSILVRLYESFGFQSMRYVGETAASVPDRLLWGAVGTLMAIELTPFFIEWSPKLKDLLAVKKN